MSLTSQPSPGSNVGKWDGWYRNLSAANQDAVLYGDAVTYLMAAAFLADVDEVEDWGCGGGGFRHFCVSSRYVGLDGSKTPFADKIVDLCTYRSTAPGIMMRHVLEHNYEWERVARFRRPILRQQVLSDSLHALCHGNEGDRSQSCDRSRRPRSVFPARGHRAAFRRACAGD